MECIVHFEIIRNGESKALRGLIDIAGGTSPTTEQLIQMFEGLGHKVTPDPNAAKTFKPVSGDKYKIRIKKLDIEGAEEEAVPDRERDALIRNFIHVNNRPI
jgi:hypothetical protein